MQTRRAARRAGRDYIMAGLGTDFADSLIDTRTVGKCLELQWPAVGLVDVGVPV